MRTRVLVLALALAACGDDGNTPSDANTFVTPDAPEFAPTITSLVASPNPVTTPGVPTAVTFTWTLLVTPTYPEPVCTMDNNVGVVTSGTPVMLTIAQQTLYTLTCENRAGKSERQVLVRVPPSAPVLATFTATPSSSPVVAGVANTITFAWTYSNTPSPAPTCSVDGGVTNLTSGAGVPMTLTQARTFRLRCTNGVGGPVYSGTVTVPDVSIPVNECNTAYAQCDAHATCADTPSSYTCTCNNGYTPYTTADGEACLFNTTTATDCDQTNCPLSGSSCSLTKGYFGSGAAGDCKRARYTFVTSVTGNGNIGGWANATGTGLAAADSICAYRASQAGLPGTYVAWLSDTNNDAYCRVQYDSNTGLHMNGKKANMCGQTSLPVQAGPWIRVGNTATNSKQWSPTIDKLLSPNLITYYAANTDETGAEIATTTDRVWTGTDTSGVYVANATCGGAGSEWSSSSSSLLGAAGDVWGGGTTWTKSGATDPNCLTTAHLRCMEVTGAPSPVLPPRHPTTTKKAFLTSVSGNGNLVGWVDNYGATNGIAASDLICQSRARYAGYANPTTYKAWLSTYPYGTSPYGITNKITNVNAGYARPDGVVLGINRADMFDNKLGAAWNVTEEGTYQAGSADTGSVVTNAYPNSGSVYYQGTSYACSYFSTSTTGYYNYFGRFDYADARATNTFSTQACDQTFRLYCVED